MNGRARLGRGTPCFYSPAAGLIRTSGEEGNQSEHPVALDDEVVDPVVFHTKLRAKAPLLLGSKFRKFGLNARVHMHNVCACCRKKLQERAHVGIRGSRLMVKHVEDGLHGEELETFDVQHFSIIERRLARELSRLQRRTHLFKCCVLYHGALLAALKLARYRVEAFFHRLHIGKNKLQIDGLHICARVGLIAHMYHIGVIKDAHYLGNRIHLPNVGEKFIAEPLSLRGPLH